MYCIVDKQNKKKTFDLKICVSWRVIFMFHVTLKLSTLKEKLKKRTPQKNKQTKQIKETLPWLLKGEMDMHFGESIPASYAIIKIHFCADGLL